MKRRPFKPARGRFWKRAALLALGASCICSALGAKEKKLNIVATTPDLAAIALEVGKDHVSVSSIAGGNQNLHMVEAKPSYMMQAGKADLWIRIGLELEAGYERPILQGARNEKVLPGNPGHLDASVGIQPLEIPGGIGASLGLTMGDVHPKGNPHYWLDPFDVRIVAANIAKKLGEIDPDRAKDYEANVASFIKRLDAATFGEALASAVGGEELWKLQNAGELDAAIERDHKPALGGWLAQMRPLKGTKIVTYHRSWTYFVSRFGLEVAAEVEPKPGIPPSPGHVVDVIDLMKKDGIKLILMEPFYDRKAPDKIAKEAGATVVVAALSVGGQPEAKDTISLMDNIVARVTAAAREHGLGAATPSGK